MIVNEIIHIHSHSHLYAGKVSVHSISSKSNTKKKSLGRGRCRFVFKFSFLSDDGIYLMHSGVYIAHFYRTCSSSLATLRMAFVEFLCVSLFIFKFICFGRDKSSDQIEEKNTLFLLVSTKKQKLHTHCVSRIP